MTIFRFDLLALAFLSAAPLTGSVAQQSAAPSCDNIDPFAVRACVDKRVATKERTLASVYSQALAAARRNFACYGREDNRSNPNHLVQSQASWRRLVADDCKVQAAFGGGSNPSISDRETDCYENALDKRIEFLGQLADGSLNAG